jgi:uncharacterized membrane protein YidH (DUF202 family)
MISTLNTFVFWIKLVLVIFLFLCAIGVGIYLFITYKKYKNTEYMFQKNEYQSNIIMGIVLLLFIGVVIILV